MGHMPENNENFIPEMDPFFKSSTMDPFKFLVKANGEQHEDAATSGTNFAGSWQPKKVNGACSEDDDGFKTPTSFDQRIPLETKQCPPAPRKPRAIPAMVKIRKPSGCSRRLLTDWTSELETMFPLAIRKKIRRPPN
ncbi:hypothetical protein SAY87_016666 [Trapa incisa]|uniref:Uncharacterized protein n=1 Tax=Trapa incisa TaxID=236973 RepID=A0AAN7QY97_9MYRT|nr:hypothetical protein SAY87_016666 [Trapa incisa]